MNGGAFGPFGSRFDYEAITNNVPSLREGLFKSLVGQPCLVVGKFLPRAVLFKMESPIKTQEDVCGFVRLDNKEGALFDEIGSNKVQEGCWVFMLEPLSDSEKKNLGKGPYTHKILTVSVYCKK